MSEGNLEEIAGMPDGDSPYYKEFVQVGSITGQKYHFKFETEQQYLLWLESERDIKNALNRLLKQRASRNIGIK